MNEVGIFDIDSINTPTNKTVDVVFLPSENVKTFTTIIYKNNKKITQNNQTNISFRETGIYKIKIKATLNDGREQTLRY